MLRRLLAAAIALSLAGFTFAAPASSVEANSENIAIPLTDDAGALTTSARSGFASASQASGSGVLSAALEDSYVIFTEPIGVESAFAVAAVTWSAGQELPAGARVEMRTLDDGVWSQWFALENDALGGTREGTEANVSGGSTGIQVRVSEGDGALPADLRIDVSYGAASVQELDTVESATVLPAASSYQAPIVNDRSSAVIDAEGGALAQISTDDDALPADVTPRQSERSSAPAALKVDAAKAAAQANIAPRSAWGANEDYMEWYPDYADFEGAIVHHTAGSNNYSRTDVPAVIRGIYSYHALTLGWGDIGYNVVVDKYGGRWEGRSGTLESEPTQMAVGGHARPRNTSTLGISVLGDYTQVDWNTGRTLVPSAEVVRAIIDVSAWKFAVARLDPRSASPLTVPTWSESSINSPLQPGTKLPRISGHRDVSNTACPGSIYNYLDEIRRNVASSYDSLVVEEKKPQVEPALRFYLNDSWTNTANRSFSWGERSDQVLVGDWNGDGKDTLALRRGNTFAFTDAASPQNAPEFTLTFGRADDEVLVGDWDGDGKDTLMLRRANTFYPKNTIDSGEPGASFNYGRVGDVVLVGDWNGDGKDTLAVRRGNHYFIRESLSSGNASAVAVYGRTDDDVFVGSFTSGSAADSLAVRRANIYYITNTIRSGTADRTLAFGRAGDETLVGDWNGDGADTLGVRRVK
ncbi:MAG: N-acetylmuramoyl-L-alanine amidase [Ancrocorticia sp.]